MPGKVKNGFTLFEMLIVVVIIGIIALSAVPVAELTYIKGKETELETNLEQMRLAIKLFKRDCRNAVAQQAGYNELVNIHDSQLAPPNITALFKPTVHEVYNTGGLNVATFTSRPYLDQIPPDPFVGAAVWLVHFASGTATAEYAQGVITHPPAHTGIFDISCISDANKRRGFTRAIDGTNYSDW